MARGTKKSRSFKSSAIVIIGEGLTEQYYFVHLKSLYKFHYSLKPHFFGTTSLKEMDSKIYEVIESCGIAVCVFDADVSERNEVEKKKLEQLRKKYGKKKNVILCDSLPSIEYWFLLHYCNTNKYFKDSKSVERVLRKFITQYEKKKDFLEKENWVTNLCAEGKMEIAQQRAEFFSNKTGSYSNIYKIFERLTSGQ
ncbi:MAG TPA: RloB family protein [Bacteroidales bacterium]|nr:RloB family protein [Bacteroidales bacterium]